MNIYKKYGKMIFDDICENNGLNEEETQELFEKLKKENNFSYADAFNTPNALWDNVYMLIRKSIEESLSFYKKHGQEVCILICKEHGLNGKEAEEFIKKSNIDFTKFHHNELIMSVYNDFSEIGIWAFNEIAKPDFYAVSDEDVDACVDFDKLGRKVIEGPEKDEHVILSTGKIVWWEFQNSLVGNDYYFNKFR